MNDTNLTKIADKIQKLLSLAGNNPSAEEAKAALLKAQQLMAEYNMSEADLGSGEQIKYSLEFCKCRVNPRSKMICMIIANAFACKVITHMNKICFFGREDNAKAAQSAMDYIHRVLERGMNAEVRKHGFNNTSEAGSSLVYNSYARGFIAGLKEQLDAQTVALAVIVPEDVKTKFNEKFPNLRNTTCRMKSGYYASAYANGHTDGRSAMSKRSLHS